MSELVRLEVIESVAIATLDNPPMNLTTLELTRALRAVVERVTVDGGIRALVVTGAGDRSFNAGSDIKEMPGMLTAGDIIERKIAFENETFTALENMQIPTIAALNGIAFGGGLELAMCCDFIVADESAIVGLPEIKLGLFPGAGGPVRAARRIGEARARRLIFLGEPVAAAVALDWGLVDYVAARGTALVQALDLARRLVTMSEPSLRLAKRAINLRRELPDSEALLQSVTLFGEVCATVDVHEGVAAFIGKRAPQFGQI